MKKSERIILTLFGEGEGSGEGAVCTAEQTAESSRGGAEMSVAGSGAGESASPECSRISEICELLGIDGDGEDSVIKTLKSRRARSALLEKLKQRRAEREYAALMSEASDLLSGDEGFELSRELSDKRFCAMIRSGLSMKEAWRAAHAEELIEKARTEAQSAALEQALREIRRQSERPSENGAGGASPASSQSGVENLSGRGIRDILRRVEKGAKIKF